jgi:hypothetical protein
MGVDVEGCDMILSRWTHALSRGNGIIGLS